MMHRPKDAKNGGPAWRRALASLEAVLATGITIPILAFLLHVGFVACRRYFQIVAELVGWPYL